MTSVKRLLTSLLFLTIANPAIATETPDTTKEDIQAFEEMFGEGPQEEDVYRVDRILVSATKRNVPLQKAPAIATVISAEEISNMGARNLKNVLKLIPNFGTSINEQGVLVFETRGIMTTLSEKLLVMIDGHPLNIDYTGSALSYVYDDLTVENIRQIEVIRGPGSALYGANAFTAVINILTNKPNDIGGFRSKASAGDFDTQKYNFTGGKLFENGFQLYCGLDYWKTDGAESTIEADQFTGTPLSNAPGKADTGFEKSDFLMKILYKDFSFHTGYVTKKRGTYAGFGYALTEHNAWDITNYWANMSYSHVFLDDFTSTIKLFYNQYEQDPSIQVTPFIPPAFPDGLIGEPKLKNRNFGSELQLNYDIFPGNHLVAGAFYEKVKQFDVIHIANFDPNTGAPLGNLQDISDWGNFNKEADREIFAFYIQDEWEIIDSLNLTVGTRYDNYNDFGDTTNARIGLVWSITDDANIKFLYGEAFRAPNFVELYNENNPVVIGNPDLEAEEISTYELGAFYRFSPVTTLDINYFYSKINNLIVYDYSTSPAIHSNLGDSTVDGVEVILSGQYSKTNYWKLTYSYQDPKDSDTKNRLPNVPRQRASFSFNYSIFNFLTFHTDILWTGERTRVAGDNREDMPSYTLVDLALTSGDFWGDFEVQLAVHNLFDKEYFDPDTSGTLQYIPNDFPREGLSAILNLTYQY